MARLVVATAAAAVATYFGGPGAGAQAFAATYGVTGFLDPNAKAQGPRLDDLKAPQASYGASIPYVEGAPRVPGIFAWASSKREIATTEEVGGKGGGGVDSTTYTYEVDVLYLLTSNPIAGVRRIWLNGALVWSVADDASDATLVASQETDKWREIRVYTGASDQLPDPTYEAAVGVGNAPAYRGRGSVFIEGLHLGGSGQVPILTFEVVTNGEPQGVGARVPFTPETEDQIEPAATRTFLNESAFDVTDDGLVWHYVASSGAGTVQYVASKLNPKALTDVGGRMFVEAYYTPLTSQGTNSSASVRLLSHSGGPGNASIRFVGTQAAGVLYITAVYFSPSSGAVTNGTPVPWLERTRLRIIYTPDGAEAYVGDVLSLSVPLVNPTTTIAVGVSNPPINNVTSYRVDGLRVYLSELLYAEPEPLDEVVSRLCLRTELLEASDIDVTALATKSVRAMAVSQVTPTRTALENLMRAYFFECAEGEKLKFVLRGGAVAETIPYEDMGCYADGDPPEPLQIIRRNDLEIPSQVTVKFANVLNDYQDGAESSDRLVTDSTAVQVVEIPLGLTPQEAKRIADVMAMDYAVSLLGLGQINLDNRYALLEPSDVVLLSGETGSTYRARFVRTSDAQGLRTVEAVIDDATIINSGALTDEDYASSTIVRAIEATDITLIDGPILRDADNEPGFYAVATPVSNDGRWPGSTLRKSLDGIDYSTDSATFTDRAIVGAASTALGDWTGGYVWDELNSVTVSVNGTLSSSTHDAIQANGTVNVIAIGAHGRWEYVTFRNAALQSEGVYVLSGLLRGRRGTEAHMGSHEAGDTVVLLRNTGLRRIEHQSTDIGLERTYKAVTFGKSLASASAETFTDTGVGLKPFSPTAAKVERDTSGNITISWVRRTRLAVRYGGSGGSYTPLGEASESYSIDVYDDDTYTTVVRTLTSTTESVSYSAADQTTDFGSAQATVYLRIYQLSAIVGRGTALEAAA